MPPAIVLMGRVFWKGSGAFISKGRRGNGGGNGVPLSKPGYIQGIFCAIWKKA